jgi:hypothetical protein
MIMSGEAIPWFETHQGFSNYLKSMTLRGKAYHGLEDVNSLGAFTLGVRDSRVESCNTMLAI